MRTYLPVSILVISILMITNLHAQTRPTLPSSLALRPSMSPTYLYTVSSHQSPRLRVTQYRALLPAPACCLFLSQPEPEAGSSSTGETGTGTVMRGCPLTIWGPLRGLGRMRCDMRVCLICRGGRRVWMRSWRGAYGKSGRGGEWAGVTLPSFATYRYTDGLLP